MAIESEQSGENKYKQVKLLIKRYKLQLISFAISHGQGMIPAGEECGEGL